MDKFEAWVAKRGLTQPFNDPWWQGRKFQLCVQDFAARTKRFILSLDKGLGKTSCVLALFEDPRINKGKQGFTVVVFTTKRGMLAYTRDIKMFPEHAYKIQLVKGSQDERSKAWRNSTARYFVVTYAAFLADTGSRMQNHSRGEISKSIVPRWVTDERSIDGVVCDEFHRVFRNRKSATFELFKKLFRYTEYFIPMSGSAVSKGPEDLWPALHLVDRKLWSTYWGYVKTWCHVDESGFGHTILGPRADRIQKWRDAVGPQVFHATALDVKDELPEINNYPLDVELEPWQRKLHDALLKDQIAEIGPGQFLFSSNRLANLFKIRLALICPKALSPELGYGSGIEAIAEDVEESEIPRYAVFTPFRAPIPYLADFLRSRGHEVIVLQGGLSELELADSLQRWRDFKPTAVTNPIVILATIKYSESWEIPEASFGYFLGYEWDNEDNDQARKRLRRLISKYPVVIQWVRHPGTYDEDQLTRLMVKNDNKKALLDDWNT